MGGAGGIAVIDLEASSYLGRIVGLMPNVRHLVMCKKLVASVDRFDKVVPLTEFLGEDNLSGKPLLVRFVNRSLDVISF